MRRGRLPLLRLLRCYPTVIEGCKKQGECAIVFIEQVKGKTNAGHNLAYSDTPASEQTPKSWAEPPARPLFDQMLSNEAMDRQLVDAEESSPGICRSIYKRRPITATHYAERGGHRRDGDVADYKPRSSTRWRSTSRTR